MQISLNIELSEASSDLYETVRRQIDDQLNASTKIKRCVAKLISEHLDDRMVDALQEFVRDRVIAVASYELTNENGKFAKSLETLFKEEVTKETRRLASEAAGRVAAGKTNRRA